MRWQRSGPCCREASSIDCGCPVKTHELAAFLAETHTSALLILKDGEIRHEQYWLTGGRDVQWISFSVAKTSYRRLSAAAG